MSTSECTEFNKTKITLCQTESLSVCQNQSHLSVNHPTVEMERSDDNPGIAKIHQLDENTIVRFLFNYILLNIFIAQINNE